MIDIITETLAKMKIKLFILIAIFMFGQLPVYAESSSNLEFFTFKELVRLSETDDLEKPIEEKLERILNIPFVDNSIAKPQTDLNMSPVYGEYVRVASWNIARGINFDTIKLSFENQNEFIEKLKETEDRKFNKKDIDKIRRELAILKETDIFLLNEVDVGMPRTDYQNIAEEFAKMLGFNYAYGVEFVEVDPTHLGIEKGKWSEETILFQNQDYVVDKAKYKGFHGNAIISKYPIKNARIIRLPKCYDWFKDEYDRMAYIEQARRMTSDFIFDEFILREIRQGSRMALIADIELPGIDKPMTVVSVHLENRVIPQDRYKQIKVLLEAIQDIENPLVMAGDFNTTTKDGRPTTLVREIKKKVKDPHFLGQQAITFAVPYSYIVSPCSHATSLYRTYRNPTVRSIPIISPNKERKLFASIKDLKFKDGQQFNFDGYKYKSIKDKWGWLANSNQRCLKGFVPTYKFNRDYGIAKFKLDWIFVKPFVEADDEQKKPRFTPYFGRTLSNLNYSTSPPISDHVPITVDLPYDPPNEHETETAIHKLEKKEKKVRKFFKWRKKQLEKIKKMKIKQQEIQKEILQKTPENIKGENI